MNNEHRVEPSEKGKEDVAAHERLGLRIDDEKADPGDMSKDGQIRVDGENKTFS